MLQVIQEGTFPKGDLDSCCSVQITNKRLYSAQQLSRIVELLTVSLNHQVLTIFRNAVSTVIGIMAASWFALITAYLLPSSPSGKTRFEFFFGGGRCIHDSFAFFPLDNFGAHCVLAFVIELHSGLSFVLVQFSPGPLL
jgi:hypothetical protein